MPRTRNPDSDTPDQAASAVGQPQQTAAPVAALVDARVEALSDDALRHASNKAIFQRGRTYASAGTVAVSSEESGDTPAIYATVTGSEPYATEVWIHEGEVSGTCDCANDQDGWFCKHQVALALVWRDRLTGQTPAIDEVARKTVQASAQRAQTVRDREQALKDFLHTQPASALAERLLDLAERDHEVARELQQWRKLSESPQTPADLKALVSDILSPGRDFLSWRETHGYVHRAQAVLPLLAQTRSRDPAVAAALCLHAMRRGWAVLLQADDSDGDIGDLVRSIGEQWVQALQQMGPQPAGFGDTYLQLLLDDPFGCFDTAAAEAAMGAAALARFRKALASRWREAKDAVRAQRAALEALVAKAAAKGRRPPYQPPDREADMRLWTLERMHLRQLEADGDIDGALAVMREDLQRTGDYHRVTEFLERHGRLREAFINAEQACKAKPDDERLQEDLLRCYDRDGWVEEAYLLRRRRFDTSPSVERYHEVLKAGAAAARSPQALRHELQALLIVREEQALARPASRFVMHGRHAGAATGQHDVSLRAEVLCSEQRWDEALALVQSETYCRDAVLVHLARGLGAHQRAQRVALLMRVFVNQMVYAKTPYQGELARVDEIAHLMEPTQRAQWLQQLRQEYKAKRNFVRDLPVQ